MQALSVARAATACCSELRLALRTLFLLGLDLPVSPIVGFQMQHRSEGLVLPIDDGGPFFNIWEGQ